jgi:hypothetical protein
VENWSVRVYPGGKSTDSAGQLSIFVSCSQAVRASFKLTVLNQKGWQNREFVSNVRQFNAGADDAYGEEQIVKATEKKSEQGHLSDDSLIITVDLTIYSDIIHSITPAEWHNHASDSAFPSTPATMHSLVSGSPSVRSNSFDDSMHNNFKDFSLLCESTAVHKIEEKGRKSLLKSLANIQNASNADISLVVKAQEDEAQERTRSYCVCGQRY